MEVQQSTETRKLFHDKKKNQSYVKGKLLGTGGFAKCYEAISMTDGMLYAAKVIPKKQINEKRQRYKLLIEIKIHKSLRHRHIVEFVDAFEDRENIYILLEHCRNYTLKDLAKRRKRLTEFQTRVYIGQLVRAMIYIHSQGIIHRDLKLGNILINDQMDVKICDFGLSTRIKHEGDVKKTICGTPNYIAPEILEEQGHSYEVDIWSVGVIMYALLFGKPPFEDNTVEQTYENIKNNRYVFPPNIAVSLAAKDLINNILVMDPTRRLSLEEMLEHEFMLFPEGVPHSLPLSSLAVPPTDYNRLPTRINLNDIQLELSEQLDPSQKEDIIDDAINNQQSSSRLKKGTAPFIFVRQCFRFQESVGYLLSNGVVGSLNKTTGVNHVFQFGQECYYEVRPGEKPIKNQTPDISEGDLARLFHFKAFFIAKYSLFKMDEMRKRTGQNDAVIFLKRATTVGDWQMATRLSNNIIQLHFKDLTSLSINRQDEKGIYLMTKKGHLLEVNYNECKNSRLKAKVRRFSNLIQKLSPKEEEVSYVKSSGYSSEYSRSVD